MSDPEACEAHREAAFAVNAVGVRNVAKSLGEAGKMVFVSSSFIFDGTKDGPYGEDDRPAPLSIYGETMLAGEQAVQEYCSDHIIARMCMLWGLDLVAGWPNLVSHTLEEMLASRKVQLLEDQKVSPTYVNQASEVLLELVSRDAKGTFNVASRACLTPLEMGRMVAESFECDKDLAEPVKMASAAGRAKQPANACLDISKVEEAVERPLYTFEESLVFFRSEVQNYHFNWGRPRKAG
jgi:dTDP-4-dehydrorhamnose reductase